MLLYHNYESIPDQTNLALNKRAFQKSSFKERWAGKAVDGNNGDASKEFCSDTEIEKDPWWIVDLESEYKITAVKITDSFTESKAELSVLR